MLANQQASPDTRLRQTLRRRSSQNHFRRRPMTPELVDEMNLEKSFAFYKDRFADASDFTFVFAGSFDVAAIKPLVERYLASLPSTGRKETWKDAGIRPPRGVVEKVVREGDRAARAGCASSSPAPSRGTPRQRVLLRVLGLILEGQLGAVLREDQSGTYGVKVTTASDKIPTPTYALSIDFSCAPERTEELVKRLFVELSRVREGPTESEVADAREAMMVAIPDGLAENAYLLDKNRRRRRTR